MFKKQNIIFFILLFFILLQNGYSQEAYSYYNVDDGYSLILPIEWEQKEGYMGTSVIALSPQENISDRFRENVNIVVEKLPYQMSLYEYFDLNIINMQRFLSNFIQHEAGQKEIDTYDSKWLIYLHTINQINIKVLVYFFVTEQYRR